MKRNSSLFSLLLIITSAFSSCQAVGDIFKAGVWTTIIVIVLIVIIILWIVSKARK